MDAGAWGLLVGLAGVAIVSSMSHAWLRAAGGLMILVTCAITALQLLGLA